MYKFQTIVQDTLHYLTCSNLEVSWADFSDFSCGNLH